MTRPLSVPQRRALDRLLARRFPATDHREVVGNTMLVGLVILVAVLIVGVVTCGGPNR